MQPSVHGTLPASPCFAVMTAAQVTPGTAIQARSQNWQPAAAVHATVGQATEVLLGSISLACPSCMPSDAASVMITLTRSGLKPCLVVLGAGHHLGHLLHHPAVPAPGLFPPRQDCAHLRCILSASHSPCAFDSTRESACRIPMHVQPVILPGRAYSCASLSCITPQCHAWCAVPVQAWWRGRSTSRRPTGR